MRTDTVDDSDDEGANVRVAAYENVLGAVQAGDKDPEFPRLVVVLGDVLGGMRHHGCF